VHDAEAISMARTLVFARAQTSTVVFDRLAATRNPSLRQPYFALGEEEIVQDIRLKREHHLT
jgi:hypothetical protein